MLDHAPCLQWVYDTWYMNVSPDREFPAEVRRVLNEAFGELCARVRVLDMRALLIRWAGVICSLQREGVGLSPGPACIGGWQEVTCRPNWCSSGDSSCMMSVIVQAKL